MRLCLETGVILEDISIFGGNDYDHNVIFIEPLWVSVSGTYSRIAGAASLHALYYILPPIELILLYPN